MKTEQEARSTEEITVFSIVQDSRCAECGEDLPRGSLLRLEQQKPLCLPCADLGHLQFLPRGDAALSRRSRKYSTLSAVVVRFSRTRGRYERQGLLVEKSALHRAEAECLTDEASRARARERAATIRKREDEVYVAEFASHLRTLYPACPTESATAIASHACLKHSGRIGRTVSAKQFDGEAIRLAVRAFIRHRHTDYDRLLNRGTDRSEARAAVSYQINEVEVRWRQPE